MLDEVFMDEVVLRFKVEQQRLSEKQVALKEKHDITKGYAYVNGEKITFSRFQLLETDLSAWVPDIFIEDSTPVITKQTVELYNYDKSVCLFFEILQLTSNEFIEFSYTEKGDENRYHLDFENAQIKGSFTCNDYRERDWKELFFQIMYSIVSSLEGKDAN